MIICRDLVDLLYDFVSGELAPERREEVERHLRDCPPCLVYCETYRITIRVARRLPCPPPPPEVMARLRSAVQASLQTPPPPRPPDAAGGAYGSAAT
jgi:anti-sigma factor RsiW